MSEKYVCPIEGCKRDFYTQVGLDVHMNTHLPPVKEEKVIEKPKPLKPAEKKENKVVADKIVSELKKDYLTEKEAKELWKARIKKMRMSGCNNIISCCYAFAAVPSKWAVKRLW